MIEEVLKQHYLMESLNFTTVNTIRIIAMRNKEGKVMIPFANIRIGRINASVDNFCSGGITAAVDINTGIVTSRAYDKDYHSYDSHPDSKNSDYWL